MSESREELAKKAEKLINELEEIYLSGNWRGDKEKSGRVKDLQAGINKIFSVAAPGEGKIV